MNEKEHSGFTLVEVVIATGILALVLSGFITTFVMSQRSAILATNQMTACHIARQNMENVLCNTYSAVSAGTHTLPTVTNNNCIFKSSYVVTQSTAYTGVKDIQMTISWLNLTGKATNTLVFCDSLSMGLHQ